MPVAVIVLIALCPYGDRETTLHLVCMKPIGGMKPVALEQSKLWIRSKTFKGYTFCNEKAPRKSEFIQHLNDLLGLASLLANDGPNSVKYLLKVLAIIIWFDCLWPFTDISNILKWLFSFFSSFNGKQ